MPNKINRKNLVLIGGGHSHALVLRRWLSKPVPELRITLVSPQPQSPYSGMLPGLLTGQYSFAQTHIDLTRLCRQAGAHFIQQAASGIDLHHQVVTLDNGQTVPYDVASINIGSTPDLSIPGSREFATPVKPIATFLQRWFQLLANLQAKPGARVVVIGGGAGSVELVMAMSRANKPEITLVTRGSELLKDYPAAVRQRVASRLRQYGIKIMTDMAVDRISQQHVQAGNTKVAFDYLFSCTQASVSVWLRESGLETDHRGFLQVNQYLQSSTASNVFGAGDCIHFQPGELPKAGVYAVREADILYHNLCALISGQQTLKPYRPQKHFLSLLSMGNQYAIGSKYGFSFAGQWVWRWKDRIDRRFMLQFQAD